jgi:hypothetical protein
VDGTINLFVPDYEVAAVVTGQGDQTGGAAVMLVNTHMQARRLAYSSTRLRAAIVAVAALTLALFAGPTHAAAEGKLPPKPQQREQLSIAPEEAMKPWSGDLDGMIKRGVIRVLTVYSKTFYFVNKGVQMGAVPDIFRVFEEDLNK